MVSVYEREGEVSCYFGFAASVLADNRSAKAPAFETMGPCLPNPGGVTFSLLRLSTGVFVNHTLSGCPLWASLPWETVPGP